MKRLIYTAAHGGFALDRVPLGGGGAVCDHLAAEWRRTRPFDLQLIEPSILGANAPKGKALVQMSELAYARFCQQFERASTEEILRNRPDEAVVLANDVSEGPDFRRVRSAGFRIYTIYHVDVLDYFARIYLHGWIRPETAAGLYRWAERTPLRRLFAGIPGLIFQKQQDSVRYSKGLIVPSEAMRQVLERCYPEAAGKVHVLPWGIWDDPVDPPAVVQEEAKLRSEFGLRENSAVLLTLSRISPEKAQDRLLKALIAWEKEGGLPPGGVTVMIAGEAAYMMGKKFQRDLERLAGRLHQVRVHFVGYASGARKQALFRLADLYVFPSRHESYGLTMLEAMRAGLPVLAAHSHGASETFQLGVGDLLRPGKEGDVIRQMLEALRRLLGNARELPAMGEAARRYALSQSFSETAAKLAALLRSPA